MKKLLLILVLSVGLCLSSCAPKAITITYDGDEIFLFSDSYLMKSSDSYKFNYYNSDEARDFIIDPFDDKNVTVLCADENSIYYQNSNREIVCRDRASERETVFFRPNSFSQMSLLGLIDAVSSAYNNDFGYRLDISGMYIYNNVGYVVYNKQLCKLAGGEYKPILEAQIENIRFDGAKVFFVDSAHNIFSCNPDGTDLTQVIEDKVENQIQIKDNKLWYRPLTQLGSLWNCSLDGTDNVCWSESGVYNFRLEDDNIFFVDKDGKLYQSKVSVKEPSLLSNENIVSFYVLPNISSVLVTTEKDLNTLTKIECLYFK